MSESSTPVLNLNTQQLTEITRLKDAAQYPTMYLYLKTQVDVALQSESSTSARHQELGVLSNWLNNAAAINAHDGSFKSEFVRGAVDSYSKLEGQGGISDAFFQKMSDNLAVEVYKHITNEQGILSAQVIIDKDVKSAVDDLHLGDQWGWAGTAGDVVPTWLGGLGGDMVQVDPDLPFTTYLAQIAEVYAANVNGTARAMGSKLMQALAGLTDGANLTTSGNESLISELQKQFNIAQNTTSPLVLDLDGDGAVETTTLSNSRSSGIHFDLDAKGLSENTGWVNTDDGLLVRDLNADGQITSGRELFGNHTLLTNGQEAANGFLALQDLDSNADGVINTQDTAFASLRIWKDINTDGLTNTGELLTLEQAGVASLNVGYSDGFEGDAQGNQHRQLGGYTTTTGTTQKMNDVWFTTDTARTQDREQNISVSTAIAALPNIEGMEFLLAA